MNNPRFPIYIVSKGRWQSRLTSKLLDKMDVPYFIIVEKQEYKNYCGEIDIKKVLILPQKYLNEYDTFWPRGEDNKTGPGPARNYAWQHSIDNDYDWHWVMDDNIASIERFNNNLKIKCESGTPFYIIEEFVLRYENIGQSGMGYAFFCKATERYPALKFNTRLYSCQLNRNDIPFRWRGRYNEDTDLSLRILKSGLCTVEFNAFLTGKVFTQRMKGGNTDEFYADEGTYSKSKMLEEMHPDVTSVVWKFGRWHHHVDYRKFKSNKLILKKGIVKKLGINNYGMKLVKII